MLARWLCNDSYFACMSIYAAALYVYIIHCINVMFAKVNVFPIQSCTIYYFCWGMINYGRSYLKYMIAMWVLSMKVKFLIVAVQEEVILNIYCILSLFRLIKGMGSVLYTMHNKIWTPAGQINTHCQFQWLYVNDFYQL